MLIVNCRDFSSHTLPGQVFWRPLTITGELVDIKLYNDTTKGADGEPKKLPIKKFVKVTAHDPRQMIWEGVVSCNKQGLIGWLTTQEGKPWLAPELPPNWIALRLRAVGKNKKCMFMSPVIVDSDEHLDRYIAWRTELFSVYEDFSTLCRAEYRCPVMPSASRLWYKPLRDTNTLAIYAYEVRQIL
jgi:hypothetical protein